MIIGTITGEISLNPIILGVVNGAGVLVAGIGKMKNYKRITIDGSCERRLI